MNNFLIQRAGRFSLLLLLTLAAEGCAPPVYFDTPLEFRSREKYNAFMQTYSSYLTGKKFYIDPGHGGKDRNNKGPAGEAVEADLNLKVGLFLRDFLTEAGATVYMSRTTDTTVNLKDRSLLANESGADIFISIHHNAPGSGADRYINYTSTYYHAKETDYEYEPMERDLAKYIQRDLAYAMRTPGGLGSFDGTYSDYWIYPGAGFSVLRHTTIPSVLVECSFHTHEYEEKRLIQIEFNRVQAWGIFRGIARYISQSIPKVSFKSTTLKNGAYKAVFGISDTVQINPRSIRVFADSAETSEFLFDESENELSISFKTPGERLIKIIAANTRGNHAYPYEEKIMFTKD
ncbi:MAG: N-acetylmuramoyl-L-alanine amidase [Ignavibacteriaceae bacterium]|nr:N-acetylmuramoyl-L-alanine amidase [Ignavibacteriaceae bacterium]